jgi:hypothetical protein
MKEELRYDEIVVIVEVHLHLPLLKKLERLAKGKMPDKVLESAGYCFIINTDRT